MTKTNKASSSKVMTDMICFTRNIPAKLQTLKKHPAQGEVTHMQCLCKGATEEQTPGEAAQQVKCLKHPSAFLVLCVFSGPAGGLSSSYQEDIVRVI